ncbi:MAG: flagellar basal body-associated FliL family protein [Pirellulales bacterium]
MSEKAHAEAAPAAAKGGLFGQMKVAGIIAGIVLAQCAFAYVLLPSAPTVAAPTDGKAEHKDDAHDEKHDHHGDHEHGHAGGDNREVDLGRFSVTSFDQTTNNTLLIDFHLYGTVAEEPAPKEGDHAPADAHGGHGKKKDAGEEPEDPSKFGKLLKKNKFRFRDQVIVIVRNTSPADLSDPALGLIKRQILAKTNSLLGEPLLKEVVFSEFSVVQQ